MKILVYDDEIDFAEFVQEAVSDFGHETVIATNSGEFADRFSAQTDLIFLDLFMPDVNGIECIRFLANTGTNALLVLMSGQDPAILNAAREGARANGLTVLDVLNKPISLSTIENTLKTAEAHLRETINTGTPKDGSEYNFSASEISAGVLKNEFFLVYQPQIRLNDRRIVGIEALLRWDHPRFGLVAPSAFIPVAEAAPETMIMLTDFVIETACRDLAAFTMAAPDLTVSLNISAATFDDVHLPDRILKATRASGLSNQRIILEVTETVASSNVGKAIDILTRLRMAGFGVSIDDFGTGYSSMEQIVRVPFTELKVDSRFVKDLLTSEKCRAICEISCLLAQKTGMIPVAEGVEDEATLRELQSIGFVVAQGFHLARPMRADEFTAWLSEHARIAANREKTAVHI